MDEEMSNLHTNKNYELTFLPPRKHVVGCHQMYIVKLLLDWKIKHLKEWLVTQAITHRYE